jgi:nitric oxide reductase subunit B
MKYETQKIAYWYFIAALSLFAVQVTGGLIAGWIYVDPNFLSDILPFSAVRMVHTNALLVWLILGFCGATYFILPEETESEIWSPTLAYAQLAIFLIGTLGAVITYVFDLFNGVPWLSKEGREFLEQPYWVKIRLVIAVLMFLVNIGMPICAAARRRSPTCCSSASPA